jgi:NADPH-dependent 2,4-dienoyl-CoA reductase/sulfur reductase-like enzyme
MREGGRLVVIGGVAAGMSAASRARRLRPDVEIIAVERGQDVSYGACSIPYFIGNVIRDRDDLVVYDADFFRRERRIDVRLDTEAVSLDPRKKTVTLKPGGGAAEQIGFDALVLATGARAVSPPIPGMDLPGVFTLRSLADGEALKRDIDGGEVKNAVIVGGGFIGLEMAEAFVERGLVTTVIEALPMVLGVYDPEISAIVEKELRRNGVIVRTNERVEGFEPLAPGGRVGYVLTGGQRVPAELVLVGVGVRPNVDLARAGGIALGPTGAIRVDARQVTSEPSVLAAGDCCEATHMVTRRPTWLPLGTTANRQGRVAGENAVGGVVQFGGVAGTKVTKVLDLEVAGTGLSTADAKNEGLDADVVQITGSSRSHAYPGGSPITVRVIFERGNGRLLGCQMVGREGVAKRIDTPAVAIQAGMSVSQLSDVDMSYAPPFSPVWDPVLIAAGQAAQRLRRQV